MSTPPRHYRPACSPEESGEIAMTWTDMSYIDNMNRLLEKLCHNGVKVFKDWRPRPALWWWYMLGVRWKPSRMVSPIHICDEETFTDSPSHALIGSLILPFWRGWPCRRAPQERVVGDSPWSLSQGYHVGSSYRIDNNMVESLKKRPHGPVWVITIPKSILIGYAYK